VTPTSIYDCDVATGVLTLRKQRPVLADPSGREFREDDYEQAREWAIADDGTRVPVSLVWRKGTPKDSPLVLYGYGGVRVVDRSAFLHRQPVTAGPGVTLLGGATSGAAARWAVPGTTTASC